MGEEFPAAAVSALYFIQDEDSAVLRTGFPEFPEEFPGRYLYAPYSLNAFYDDSTRISL